MADIPENVQLLLKVYRENNFPRPILLWKPAGQVAGWEPTKDQYERIMAILEESND